MRAITTLSFLLTLTSLQAWAADYYVSAERGKGKKATIEKPAKDLGNIIKKLQPGDTVHIAGGVYYGRGRNGSDVITVPVNIIGGYDEEFKTRDPWGAHQTILSGDNLSDNWVATPRLMIDLMKYREKAMPSITVDGLIIDNAERNRYKTEAQQEIIYKANPKTGQNPTPSMGGLIVRVSKTGDLEGTWDITVQNCIVTNTAQTQGALSVSGYRNSTVKIHNNVVINNTGTGIYAGTKFASSEAEAWPKFDINHNTVLFTWNYEPSSQSFSGNSMKFDASVNATLTNNILGFADKFGLHNAAKATVLLKDNLIFGNVQADYLEFDTRIALADIEDEAEYLHEDSEENLNTGIQPPVAEAWRKLYASRVLVDRNAAEADIQAQQTAANELRSILGLPVQAGTVDMPTSPVWLPRLSREDAVKTAVSGPYESNYGARKQ